MNAVDRAVQLVGGPTQASFICRCSAASIYKWRQLGFVYDSRAAVRLARASGVPVEQLAGLAETEGGGTDGPAPMRRTRRRRRGGTSATYPVLTRRRAAVKDLPAAADRQAA